MSTDNQVDRRRFTRIPVRKEVTLYTGMQCWTSHIHDLSLKGALLSCPKEHVLKSGDLLRLSIPVDNSPAIIMNIEVIHSNGETFGAEWTQIDMDSFAILKRTIELNIKEKENLRKDIKTLSE
ncbi:PilZ domain-containing protein [Marinicella sediminis]|uniref:Cyclic diguanosine monophosphate-binding protein n=1 Tax=Marinicella sediminis TaxID=1792834 RepID=A0ABV7J7E0_9GAMM|nr:PilZ domain-containing protein [Marinicella sediminis]